MEHGDSRATAGTGRGRLSPDVGGTLEGREQEGTLFRSLETEDVALGAALKRVHSVPWRVRR